MVELSIVNSRSDAGAIMCPNWRNRNQNRFAARALQVQPLPQGHAVWPTTGFFEGARLERGPGSAAAFPLALPPSRTDGAKASDAEPDVQDVVVLHDVVFGLLADQVGGFHFAL